MNGIVHVTIGYGTIAALFLSSPDGFHCMGAEIYPIISAISVAAGSYAPDVDNPRTHAGHKHKVVSKVTNKYGGGHRGITHTLLVPAILAAVLSFCSTRLSYNKIIQSFLCSLVFGFLVGYVMHLFADMFNGKGIPLFWPLTKKKVHIMDLPSTGTVPWIYSIILIIVMVYLAIGGVL